MPSKLVSARLLLLSRDFGLISEVCNAAQALRISCEICSEGQTALKRMCKGKYEGILIDYQSEPDAARILSALRTSTSHRTAITFGIIEPGQGPEAARAGLHFVLSRPLDHVHIRQTVRAALPLLIRERRRYFRADLGTAVVINSATHGRMTATSLNISEVGMALECGSRLPAGEKVSVEFQLPGLPASLVLNAEVCWAREKLIGLQFQQVPAPMLEGLKLWLSKRLEEIVPELAAP